MKIGRLPLFLPAFLVAALLPISGYATFVTEFEAGQQLGFGFGESKVTRKRFYLSAKADQTWDLASEADTDAGSLALNGFVRAWGDFQSELDVRTLSVVWNRKALRAELGFQEIPWGETFGFFIADLVNPRDYRDALFNELAWTRLSVFALNTQLFLEKFTLQLVMTPVPRLNKLPEPVVNRTAFQMGDIREAAEYGGRASYLFDSGLDLGLIYYRHWNRNPAVQVGLGPDGGIIIEQTAEKVHTFGFTGSQAMGDWVFRADSVVHLAPSRANNWQLILGADRGDAESVSWGAQYHLDREREFQHWVSATARTSWANRKLEAELFVFKGLDNADFWAQPKLTWYFNDALAWSARVDLVSGSENPGEGALSTLAKQDRFLSWVSIRF